MPYITSVEKIGIEKGIEKGVTKGARKMLSRMITLKFKQNADHFIPLLLPLSEEQLDALAEKILETDSIDEMEQWIYKIKQ